MVEVFGRSNYVKFQIGFPNRNWLTKLFIGTVMQIEKALINDRLSVSNVS